MGLIHADITLTNESDLALSAAGQAPARVRRERVRCLVDTGALHLVLTTDVQELLELPTVRTIRATMADGHRSEVSLAGPVRVDFENRTTSCLAMIMPGAGECLLGAIPMEGMDVMIDPARQRLVVDPANPDVACFPVMAGSAPPS